MSRLPRLTGKEVVSALTAAGFEIARVKGSHLRHADGRVTVVPVHTGEVIGLGLMLKILRDCEMTPEEFDTFL